tara:strand:+ start:724 stop:933 length:210 start_codon:yes stop_codon:yes gene_type:complete
MADKKKSGYKFKASNFINPLKLESLATTGGLDQLVQLFGYSGLFKDGGRVRRGCGIAKRGFGRTMKRKK